MASSTLLAASWYASSSSWVGAEGERGRSDGPWCLTHTFWVGGEDSDCQLSFGIETEGGSPVNTAGGRRADSTSGLRATCDCHRAWSSDRSRNSLAFFLRLRRCSRRASHPVYPNPGPLFFSSFLISSSTLKAHSQAHTQETHLLACLCLMSPRPELLKLRTRSHPLSLNHHGFGTRACACLKCPGLMRQCQLLGGRGPAGRAPDPP